jgi:hypothetical protein
MGRTMIVQREDIYLFEHPELGLSTYDLHSDGSGVCYSTRFSYLLPRAIRTTTSASWRRPISCTLVRVALRTWVFGPTWFTFAPLAEVRSFPQARSPSVAVSHNNYDNNVSRVTANVLQSFIADELP